MTRRAKLVFEPLADWPHPPVRHERSPFTARWTATRDLLRAKTGSETADMASRAAFRTAARLLHPDVGGSVEDWETLDQARQLLERAGML